MPRKNGQKKYTNRFFSQPLPNKNDQQTSQLVIPDANDYNYDNKLFSACNSEEITIKILEHPEALAHLKKPWDFFHQLVQEYPQVFGKIIFHSLFIEAFSLSHLKARDDFAQMMEIGSLDDNKTYQLLWICFKRYGNLQINYAKATTLVVKYVLQTDNYQEILFSVLEECIFDKRLRWPERNTIISEICKILVFVDNEGISKNIKNLIEHYILFLSAISYVMQLDAADEYIQALFYIKYVAEKRIEDPVDIFPEKVWQAVCETEYGAVVPNEVSGFMVCKTYANIDIFISCLNEYCSKIDNINSYEKIMNRLVETLDYTFAMGNYRASLKISKVVTVRFCKENGESVYFPNQIKSIKEILQAIIIFSKDFKNKAEKYLQKLDKIYGDMDYASFLKKLLDQHVTNMNPPFQRNKIIYELIDLLRDLYDHEDLEAGFLLVNLSQAYYLMTENQASRYPIPISEVRKILEKLKIQQYKMNHCGAIEQVLSQTDDSDASTESCNSDEEDDVEIGSSMQMQMV